MSCLRSSVVSFLSYQQVGEIKSFLQIVSDKGSGPPLTPF